MRTSFSVGCILRSASEVGEYNMTGDVGDMGTGSISMVATPCKLSRDLIKMLWAE